MNALKIFFCYNGYTHTYQQFKKKKKNEFNVDIFLIIHLYVTVHKENC